MQEVLRRTVLLRILLTTGTAFKDIEKIVLVQKSNGIRLGYFKKAEEGWFYAFLRH